MVTIRSILITIATFLVGCSAHAGGPEICYSKFSPSKKPEFKHALTEGLAELYDALVDAYNDDTAVVDIPLMGEGNVYLASTCEYAASLQQRLDKSILFTKISKDEFEDQDNLASQNRRIIEVERN
jgi:hypothetical protein